MLEEYKELYIQCANLIPNWEKLSKSELANKYLESEEQSVKDACLSALMCKYWNLIGSYYYRQGIKQAQDVDCYDWLTEGILKALNQHVWTNPDNVLFNDKKGPEKAMTVCISSARLTYYQYINHDNRKLNYQSISLESIETDSSDGYFMPTKDKYFTVQGYVQDLVKQFYKVKDYFICFFIDALFNDDLVDIKMGTQYSISINKFNKYVTEMTEDHLKIFSQQYDIKFNEVKDAFFYIKIMPTYRVHANINRGLNILKNDQMLLNLLVEQ